MSITILRSEKLWMLQKEERLPATSFGTKIFWEYQLYISYVLPRPQRFKNEIWESENRKIFHKLFPKIVIDPV